MNVFLVILLLIVLSVVGFYILMGLQAFIRWLSMFVKYLEVSAYLVHLVNPKLPI